MFRQSLTNPKQMNSRPFPLPLATRSIWKMATPSLLKRLDCLRFGYASRSKSIPFSVLKAARAWRGFLNGIPSRNMRLSPAIQPAAENFRITDEHLGEGGAKAKYAANITAIRTLQTIEAENRSATSERAGNSVPLCGLGAVYPAGV